MEHLIWTEQEAEAVLGAMKNVLTESSTKQLTDIQLSFVEGVNKYLLDSQCRLASIQTCQPNELSQLLNEDAKRLRAIQLLIVVPYLDIDVTETKVQLVDAYAKALSIHPDTLKDLHRIKDHHITMMQLCLVRKTMPLYLNKKSVPKNLEVLWDLIKESKPNQELTNKYKALENYPEDTLGYNFIKFYRSRGFPLPGEEHSLPPTLIDAHDISHLVGGFNTDEEGEILVSAFQGGYVGEHGWTVAIIALLDFHCGIPYDTAGFVPPAKGKLVHSDKWVQALRLGMDCKINFYHPDYDPWKDFPKTIDDLRREYGLTKANSWRDIIDNPPQHPSADRRAQPIRPS